MEENGNTILLHKMDIELPEPEFCRVTVTITEPLRLQTEPRIPILLPEQFPMVREIILPPTGQQFPQVETLLVPMVEEIPLPVADLQVEEEAVEAVIDNN